MKPGDLLTREVVERVDLIVAGTNKAAIVEAGALVLYVGKPGGGLWSTRDDIVVLHKGQLLWATPRYWKQA